MNEQYIFMKITLFNFCFLTFCSGISTIKTGAMSEITFCQLVQGKQAQSSGSVIEVVGCTPANTTPLL